ncbi:MAG: ATP-binding protein [Lachnospiraceae bacterium]|nr:ATP-binding protein [Lachnospiraceae bacterium]
MLIQFTMRNVLSFKKETVLDMSAVGAYQEHKCNLINYPETDEQFLRVAAVYGANASGKSNLYTGLCCFQYIVRESMDNIGEDGMAAIRRYYAPFRFDEDKESSEFQICLLADGYEYKYGFEYNAECILEEWLYRKSLVTGSNAIILERSGRVIRLGEEVSGECDSYRQHIPQNTLALSFFNKLNLNTDIFSRVFKEISDIMVIPTDFYEDTKTLKEFLPSIIDLDHTKLVSFLKAIDSGILDIGYKEQNGQIAFYTLHKDQKGNEYEMDLMEESQGTIKSISIYISARIAIKNNKSVFVDELNAKLHPLLLKFIIDLFYENDSTAQLVYTTHDTTLLDKKFFRRDQIWFVQKDEFGHSDLTALSDYRVRSDDSFERDYLAGVYGGIPMIKEFFIREG